MRKAFEKIRRITLRKRSYRVVLASKLGPEENPIFGDCSDPNNPNRTIRYYCGLKGERRLDVLIHEMLHACFWDVSEEGIEQSASDVARSLWRLGWHMDDEEGSGKRMPQYVTLRGKRYKYERVSGLQTGINGITDAPHIKGKAVKIRVSLKGEKELAEHIKYMLYACFWDFDEGAIQQTSKDIARALVRIGYYR
jgi:hypothetical protein